MTNRADWITDAMVLRASTVHNANPRSSDQCITLGEARRILEAALNEAIITSRAIYLLEDELAQLRAHNTALQAHNTELVLRAREAEQKVKDSETNCMLLSVMCPMGQDHFGVDAWRDFIQTVKLPE